MSIDQYIARIAKAARHKLPGKSSLNVSSVLSCPLHHVYHHDQVIDHGNHDDHGHHDGHGDDEEGVGYIRKLEVVHKED